MQTSGPILFFDGVCGLCDRLVQFVLRRDRRARFRFAALQSDLAAATLARFGKSATDLDTVYVLTDDGRLLQKARAIFFVLRQLGLPWSLVAVFGVLPTVVVDWFYDRVAHNRYRIWGKRDSCRLPSSDERVRFLG
ncbi:MAG TPA: DCC1-like thiol-disulfide oxidoreductase family protein [Polyangia bacterium]